MKNYINKFKSGLIYFGKKQYSNMQPQYFNIIEQYPINVEKIIIDGFDNLNIKDRLVDIDNDVESTQIELKGRNSKVPSRVSICII
jgi:hypothetical protein